MTKLPESIVKFDGDENVYCDRKKRSFAYYVFANNLIATPLEINVWTQFAKPTGGLLELFDHCQDFTPLANELGLQYVGTTNKWFNLSAVTNIYKTAVGAISRTLELQWRVNGVFVGFSRQCQSETTSNIYTGNGLLYLQPNDILTPWVRNIENSDGVLLNNASFTLTEEQLYYY